MFIARPLSGARLTTGQARGGGLFRIKPKVRIHFFDRRIIRTRWRRFNRDPMLLAAAAVMRIARQSIRRRKKKNPSPIGTPPFSHQSGAVPPFKQIYFKPLNFGTSAIVGMVGYTRQAANPPPGLQEHGGYARRKVFARVGQRRLKSGRYGKMAYSYKPAMVKYPQRAFMFPALLRARSRLPHLWAGSFSR
jgi:hypothetical protein